MTEWPAQFFDLFAHNMYFRAGFLWALLMGAGVWVLFVILKWFYVRWLKIRQFFEPSKQPGKMPVEAGTSPARKLLGCLGNLFVLILFLGVVMMGLFFVAGPGGR